MKRYALNKLLAIVVFVTPQLFILNSAVAGSDCNIACQGSFVIDEIETDPAHPEVIVTVWGVGYKMNFIGERPAGT